MTPAKMAKKYQACCARPSGGGISAMTIAIAIGTSARQRRPGGAPVAAAAWGAGAAGTLLGVVVTAMRSLHQDAGGEVEASLVTTRPSLSKAGGYAGW